MQMGCIFDCDWLTFLSVCTHCNRISHLLNFNNHTFMNIFANLKVYSPSNEKKYNPEPEEPESRFQKMKETVLEYLPAVGVYLGLLIISGLFCYFGNISFFGFVFWGLVSLLAFITITSGFAHLSDFFVKKFGENIGMNIGCLGMASGVIITVIIFVSSIPYWDYEKKHEIEGRTIVYWTPYGECYHSTPECFHIEGHEIHQGTEYKAEKKHLRPCRDCY